LRLLELEVLKAKIPPSEQNKFSWTLDQMIKVSVNQFCGIEIEDFPCQIAQVGMWLTDHQMNMKVSEHFGLYFMRLPLTQSALVVHGNALRIDWENVIPKNELNYILGNPPFLGGMTMSRCQKKEIVDIVGDVKGVGEMDYVAAWYAKSSDLMKNTRIKAALVSTNSITQGQQAVTLWKHLTEKGININFAYRSFVWNNEAKGKAAVHCVIVGFSHIKTNNKKIFDIDKVIPAQNINSYLMDAPNVFIESRSNPLCSAPTMHFGNMPRDGGGFILSSSEKDYLLINEPIAEKWIKTYIGSHEFINNEKRWCLWLVGANPNELKQCPTVMQRIESVKKFRLKSVASGTRKLADTPTLFAQITQPEGVDYIIIPSVSSEKRLYIPIGFMKADTIVSNAVQIIPGASLYHFGILTSVVHMSWMRAVCGRLKSDYRYSKDIVYNNFPWPDLDSCDDISGFARTILETRALFSDSSLAALYDPLIMPPALLKAHKELDRAVMRLYSFRSDLTETEIVRSLMERHLEIVRKL
jgi:hypothetical protein